VKSEQGLPDVKTDILDIRKEESIAEECLLSYFQSNVHDPTCSSSQHSSIPNNLEERGVLEADPAFGLCVCPEEGVCIQGFVNEMDDSSSDLEDGELSNSEEDDVMEVQESLVPVSGRIISRMVWRIYYIRSRVVVNYASVNYVCIIWLI